VGPRVGVEGHVGPRVGVEGYVGPRVGFDATWAVDLVWMLRGP
jgi:hypothetical protein